MANNAQPISERGNKSPPQNYTGHPRRNSSHWNQNSEHQTHQRRASAGIKIGLSNAEKQYKKVKQGKLPKSEYHKYLQKDPWIMYKETET